MYSITNHGLRCEHFATMSKHYRYACCMQQSTYCVSKTEGSEHPARCCPRWTIGCEAGTVGCCDPAQPWQWTVDTDAHRDAFTRRGGDVESGVGSPPPTGVDGTHVGAACPSTNYFVFTCLAVINTNKCVVVGSIVIIDDPLTSLP